MSDFFVSPLTAATLVVGVVVAIFYLRNMWLVLQRTAETLDEPEDKRPDAFAYSFLGAVVAVVASWLAIAAYGAVADLPLCRRRARALEPNRGWLHVLSRAPRLSRDGPVATGPAFLNICGERRDAEKTSPFVGLHPAWRQQSRHRHVATSQGQDQLGLEPPGLLAAYGADDGARAVRRDLHRRRTRSL